MVQKRHNVNDTIILHPYVTESCGFQQKCSEIFFYVTKVSIWIEQLNVLCYCCWQLNYAKTLLPSTLRCIKTCHFYFFNSCVKHWPILIFLVRDIKKKLETNVYSFGHLALKLLLHYLMKCRSRSLTIDNNVFILGSAFINSKKLLRPRNHWKFVTSSVF